MGIFNILIYNLSGLQTFIQSGYSKYKYILSIITIYNILFLLNLLLYHCSTKNKHVPNLLSQLQPVIKHLKTYSKT